MVTLLEGHPISYLDFMFDQSNFTQVQVAARKQVFPFEQQLYDLFLIRFGPLPEALEVQSLQGPSLLWIAIEFLSSPYWEDHWWHLVGRYDLANHSLCRDFDRMGA